MTSFSGRRVAVFGLARSGLTAALALQAGCADVACWDDSDGRRAAASAEGLPVVDLRTADWSQFQALVLAPGVPLTHPVPHWTVATAQAAGVEIIGDIELFLRERAKTVPASPLILITGTNGKSTTTALITHLLRHAGRDVAMGGNIGVGVLALPPPAAERVHVLEVSSFQIELTPSLLREPGRAGVGGPTVGIVLNVTPDHLDRHGTLEHYAALKARVAASADHAVIGCDDDFCRAMAGRRANGGSRLTRISAAHQDVDIYAENGVLHQSTDGGGSGVLADFKGVGTLLGAHNGQNAAAAFAGLLALGIPATTLNAGLKTFPGLPHRMEPLGHLGRALVINDSKATNADSAEKALACFPAAIFWIVGGVAKEGGIAPLAQFFPRITKAYLIGEAAAAFARTLDGRVAYEHALTLDAALTAAARDADLSDDAAPVILFSPACASFDQYRSFEQRGDHFRALVVALQHAAEQPS